MLTSTAIGLKDRLVWTPAAAPPEDFLRVTEIMYHPEGNRHFEFIELQNTGPRVINLSEVVLRGGIEFSFQDSHVTTLGPGEYVILVKDRALAAKQYSTEDLRIGGEYSGRLSNGGESIVLAHGEVASCFFRLAYDDAWYPSTNGAGHSLVIRNPDLPKESWRKKENWRPSSLMGGSPGADD